MVAMTRRLLATLLFSVAAFSSLGSAEACSCAGSGSPCDAAWRADALFVGHVVSMSAISGGRRVDLAVIEPFRGLQMSQVTVVTGYGSADCGYPFEMGQSYLIYAHRTPDGQLLTSICSRTRPLRDAGEDLAYARSLASIGSISAARLPGRVVLWEYPAPAGGTLTSVPGVSVTASGGGRTFSAIANDRGEFELTGLPLGTYDVMAVAPDGYAAIKRSVDIHDPRGCGTTTLYVQYDGRVIGRVVDSHGAGVPALPIELVLPADVDTPGGGKKKVFGRTTEDGTFELRLVTPDRYLLGFNSIPTIDGQHSPRHSFYPGVFEPGEAHPVVVAVGGRVHLEPFVIPDTIKLVTISGIVVDEAGAPVGEAQVTSRDRTEGPDTLGPMVTTGSDGRFVLTVVANGRPYEVLVTRYVRTAGKVTTVQTGMSRFAATAGTPTITVVVKPQY